MLILLQDGKSNEIPEKWVKLPDFKWKFIDCNSVETFVNQINIALNTSTKLNIDEVYVINLLQFETHNNHLQTIINKAAWNIYSFPYKVVNGQFILNTHHQQELNNIKQIHPPKMSVYELLMMYLEIGSSLVISRLERYYEEFYSQIIESLIDQNLRSITINFGAYKGNSLATVVKNDPNFIQNCYEKIDGFTLPPVYSFQWLGVNDSNPKKILLKQSNIFITQVFGSDTAKLVINDVEKEFDRVANKDNSSGGYRRFFDTNNLI